MTFQSHRRLSGIDTFSSLHSSIVFYYHESAYFITSAARARVGIKWMSVKELQVLCGRLDFMHICDQRRLVSWSTISRMKSVVMQACYWFTAK